MGMDGWMGKAKDIGGFPRLEEGEMEMRAA